MGDIVGDGNRARLTLARTQAAGQTTGVAQLTDNRTLLRVAALDRVYAAVGQDLNQVLRAGLDALAAGDAFGAVHDRHAVNDMDGVKLAGGDTAAITEAALLAGPDPLAGQGSGRLAVLNADVVALDLHLVAGAGALDKGHPLLQRRRRDAHDDLLRHGGATHRTAVDRGLSLGNGGRHRITAGIAAGAAVIARKALAHSGLLLIHFHFELLAGKDQHQADQQADDRHDHGGGDDHGHSLFPLPYARPLKP